MPDQDRGKFFSTGWIINFSRVILTKEVSSAYALLIRAPPLMYRSIRWSLTGSSSRKQLTVDSSEPSYVYRTNVYLLDFYFSKVSLKIIFSRIVVLMWFQGTSSTAERQETKNQLVCQIISWLTPVCKCLSLLEFLCRGEPRNRIIPFSFCLSLYYSFPSFSERGESPEWTPLPPPSPLFSSLLFLYFTRLSAKKRNVGQLAKLVSSVMARKEIKILFIYLFIYLRCRSARFPRSLDARKENGKKLRIDTRGPGIGHQ